MTQNETIDRAYLMTKKSRTIYLTIAVEVEDTADCQEVVEDLDYDIKHPKIIYSEIIDSEIIEHQVEEL